VDVQLAHSFSLTVPGSFMSFAPRLVLMRCTTRSLVVLTGHFYLLLESPCLTGRCHSEETHMCPVGKVPVKSLFSSSNHSLFSKVCLFPAIGSHSRVAHPKEE